MRYKTCTKCQQQLPIDSFYRSHKGKAGTQIYKPKCKECDNANSKIKYHALTQAGKAEWYGRSNRNKEYHKNYRLLNKYGISLEQFNEMYTHQDGKCFICAEHVPSDKIHVDHCHNTNVVRKLLCHHCNVILGLAKESPEILEKCAEYLRDHV